MTLSGVINLDKPAGISSAFAVNKVKRLIPRGTKIGHAGTLDPFATGVLLLLVGKATKLCESLMSTPKQYEATVKFGGTTATDDPESPVEPWPGGDVRPVSREGVEGVIPRFVGEVMQMPPAFSAMKVGGQRAYHLARKGHDVELAARPVRIYGIEVLGYEWPDLRLRIDCGRGTYIRSIARDLGKELEVGGYLTQLRRTRVGPFWIDKSVTLEQLAAGGVEGVLTPVAEVLPGGGGADRPGPAA